MSYTCIHFQPADDGGYCAIHAKGKGVMVGAKVCRVCPQYRGSVVVPAARLPGPGDVLSGIIKRVTGVSPCASCKSWVRQMNEWGWAKCWSNRSEICQRLQEEAAKRGVYVEKPEVLSLIESAFRVWRNGGVSDV